MEGSPNGAIRPNFDLSRLACMKRIGGIVFTGWALGAAIWALPASAEEKVEGNDWRAPSGIERSGHRAR
jgi:hypothetical protein